MQTGILARLHILIARDATTALVIRRGPAKQVCTFSWDRKNDLVTLAQWMKGRIYERRSDLSPDGRHWIYFAMNGQWNSESKGSWTVVACAPWLKARVFFPKGDCWHGGGLFLDNTTYWVNGSQFHQGGEPRSAEITEDRSFIPPEWYGGECLNVYFNRLQRNGWRFASGQSWSETGSSSIFQKELSVGWTLKKYCRVHSGRVQGKSVYYDQHALENLEGECFEFPRWEWADWVDGNLVYADSGCLYRRAVKSKTELGEARLIHDFNGYTFEARTAPY